MLRRHSIINRKNRNAEFVRPLSGVILHRSTRKSHKSTSMHMHHNLLMIINLSLGHASSLLKLWILHQFPIAKHSHLYRIFSLLKNIQTLLVLSIKWDVYFYVSFYAFICDLGEFFSSSEVWNIPDLLGHLQCWISIENKTFEFCRIVHDEVLRKRESELDLFNQRKIVFLPLNGRRSGNMHHLLQSLILLLQSLQIFYLLDSDLRPNLRVILFGTIGDVFFQFKRMEVIQAALQFCLDLEVPDYPALGVQLAVILRLEKIYEELEVGLSGVSNDVVIYRLLKEQLIGVQYLIEGVQQFSLRQVDFRQVLMHLLVSPNILNHHDEQLVQLIMQLSNSHIFFAPIPLLSMNDLALHLLLVHFV